MYLEPDTASSLGALIGRLTFDPWIGMLGLGALGGYLHNPFLMHISYAEAVLAVIIIQAFSPHHTTKWRLKYDKKKGKK
jgi:hypothetical protein